jgi:hypothetical protein
MHQEAGQRTQAVQNGQPPVTSVIDVPLPDDPPHPLPGQPAGVEGSNPNIAHVPENSVQSPLTGHPSDYVGQREATAQRSAGGVSGFLSAATNLGSKVLSAGFNAVVGLVGGGGNLESEHVTTRTRSSESPAVFIIPKVLENIFLSFDRVAMWTHEQAVRTPPFPLLHPSLNVAIVSLYLGIK